MAHHVDFYYLEFDNERFFTVVLLPNCSGSFPTVIFRTPYVQNTVEMPEHEIAQNCLYSFKLWLDRGYAAVFQHCRGTGKSSGAFVPYVHEREDGLALRHWIREQSFYNGELFLIGSSYSASLHYTTAPFEEDIKGAVFEVQDSERYRLWYRNGQMRKGHANWHFDLYKGKCNLNKNFSIRSFSELPLKNLSQRVLNDTAEDFEQMLLAPRPTDKFWSCRFGGIEAKNATDNTHVPILLTTGYNDFYVGGMFKMWDNMDEKTKQNCAFVVSPYNHGDGFHPTNGLSFENGKRSQQFGNAYQIDWFDNVRNGTPQPFKKGEITYYRTFEGRWQVGFNSPVNPLTIPLGDTARTFIFNPLNPPSFNEEGTFLSGVDGRDDVITVYTEPLQKDLFIKGQIKAKLTVCSNRPDTSFYMCISIKKPQGDYVLRHDITSLCYQLGDYEPNREVELDFCFDQHAFLLKAGEVLRIDISSTDNNTYVTHTNQKGPYSLQNNTEIAQNTVNLIRSAIILPVEE